MFAGSNPRKICNNVILTCTVNKLKVKVPEHEAHSFNGQIAQAKVLT